MTQDPRASLHDEMVRAYYPGLLSAGQAARGRAQVAFTITSAIATALVAGGAITDISQRSVGVQLLSLACLALWLASAFFFLRAVASPVEPKHVTATKVEFVDHAIDNAEHERDEILQRQGRALLLAGFAITSTVVLLSILLLSRASTFDGMEATVSLQRDFVASVQRVCIRSTSEVTGTIESDRLGDDFVEVRNVTCGRQRVTLHLPSSEVSAVVVHADPDR